MSFSPVFNRRRFAVGTLAALVAVGSGFVAAPRTADAHEADCPLCQLKVVQDTPTQDNEVALRFGRKRIEYRCVWCALTEAQTDFPKGNLTILAPSEIKGKPVLISRTDGSWSTGPTSAVFLGVNAGHKSCPITYRAFSGQAAFDAYVKKTGGAVKGAKPLTLTQLLATTKSA
ncbi:MAG: hypothetical protein V4671_06045 [Armatimonadota bacterium]